MLGLKRGRFAVRLADRPEDLQAVAGMRYRAFRSRRGEDGQDVDRFDDDCAHVLIEEHKTGRLACSYRLLTFENGSEIRRSYSAQYYELSALESFDGPMVELGRFCIAPEFAGDPDVLRVAWGAMTRYVDRRGVKMLFGCSSFAGTTTEQYRDAFAMLHDRHLAPKRWWPKVKAPDVFRYCRNHPCKTDERRALQTMPPLLRTYLLMGGWVSDHAVLDRELNTMHVFTGLEIACIPPARVKALRAVAG